MASASQAEIRQLIRRLWIISAVALILATATTLVIFATRNSIPTTFLSDLVSLNAILVAAMAFLIPHVFQVTKLNDFANTLWKSTIDNKTSSLNKIFQRKFLAKAMHDLIVVPLLVTVPFFISAVIALVATLCYAPVLLASISFWIMLAFFLIIVIGLWQIAVFFKRTVGAP